MGTPASPGARSRPRKTTTDRPHLHLHIPVMAGTDAAGTFHSQPLHSTPATNDPLYTHPRFLILLIKLERYVHLRSASVHAPASTVPHRASCMSVPCVVNTMKKTRRERGNESRQSRLWLIPNLVDHGFHLLSLSKEAYPSTNTGVFSFPPTATSTPDPNTHLSTHAHVIKVETYNNNNLSAIRPNEKRIPSMRERKMANQLMLGDNVRNTTKRGCFRVVSVSQIEYFDVRARSRRFCTSQALRPSSASPAMVAPRRWVWLCP